MTANSKDSGIGKRVRVEAETLEALEDRHGIRFDTLILDIEGGEFDFFSSWAEPRCSIVRDPRQVDHTICTAVAPEEVFTVRTYPTRTLRGTS